MDPWQREQILSDSELFGSEAEQPQITPLPPLAQQGIDNMARIERLLGVRLTEDDYRTINPGNVIVQRILNL